METKPTSFQESRQSLLLIATIVGRSPEALPFAQGEENAAYGHLAALCAELGLDLHLAHHDNLSGKSSALAWSWRDGQWRPGQLPLAEVSLCYADLPPNFPRAGAFRQALEPLPMTIVNALPLSDLLTDKLATHEFFEDYVPPTWSAGRPGLVDHLRKVRLHSDISADKFFLKPRYGERGRGIYVTDLEGLAEHPALEACDYILQAFLETRCGIPELGIHERHDLRLILRDGEIVLAFARMPRAGSYVSNCSQGGREVPLAIERLPKRVTRFAADVDARLDHFGSRLYSLDLGLGPSGKIWIYELNTMPGIVWDDDKPENKPLHCNMHRILADWLAAAPLQALPSSGPDLSVGSSSSSVALRSIA
ncbi:MAG: hypothetical protein AAF657_13230 [Acidobacteriota bacterium]